MHLDAQLIMSDAQALTATAVSSNAYDSGAAANDIFNGEPMALVVEVDVAADFTTGDETYEIQVIDSAAGALSSEKVLVSRTILASALTAGSVHVIPVPSGAKTLRYVGAKYVLAGTTPTVTLTAHFQPLNMVQRYKAYAKNYTIS